MTLRAVLASVAIAAIAGTGGFFAYRLLEPPPPGPAEFRPDVVFQDLQGQPRHLREWNGKLVLVNFWATWCTPCLHEIPMLTELQGRYAAHGLQIIGPALDDLDAVTRFRERLSIGYPVFAGEADILEAMDALGDTLGALPFSVLIDQDGRIIKRKSGEWRREELVDLIEEYIAA